MVKDQVVGHGTAKNGGGSNLLWGSLAASGPGGTVSME